MEKFGGRQKVISGPFFVLPFYLTCSPKHNKGTRDRLKHQATFDGVVRIKNLSLASLGEFLKTLVPGLVPKRTNSSQLSLGEKWLSLDYT